MTNPEANKQNPEFATHKLNEEGFGKAAVIRDAFDDCLNTLTQVCSPGREFSVAKTKLEEACFFAKKSMATNLANQQPQ